MFFICHDGDKDKANLLYTYFKDGYKNFPKLNQLLKVPLNIIKTDQITFTDIENPLPEIRQSLFSKSFDPNIRYIAIYLSPISKNEHDIAKLQYYFQVKEELLNKNLSKIYYWLCLIDDFLLFIINLLQKQSAWRCCKFCRYI